MNKLERYSLHSGLKISKPFSNDCFFPILYDKYICFHSEHKIESKKYSYWQEVIETISPFLAKDGIEIVQIGKPDSFQINGVKSLKGVLNFNQESYVIKKSLLYFGADGYQIQLASHYDVPFVSLYSMDESSSARPIWGDRSNQKVIDSPKLGKKASHAIIEEPKTINNVSPYEISGQILDLLNIKHDLYNKSILNIGINYHIPTMEIIPDFIPNPNFLLGSVLNIRMDLCHNEDHLPHWAHSRKLGIITKQPINPNILLSIKDSVLRVSLEMSDNTDENFLNFLKSSGIDYQLFSKDKKSLRKYRLKYIDEDIILNESFSKKNLDKEDKICDTTLVKSSKVILSKGKKYQTIAHWITDQEWNGSPQSIIDTNDFWEDGEHYIIYNEEKNYAEGKTKGEQK